MTMTGTITGKDTNPFSEGHETKPYLGGRKTEVLGEKTTAFLRGTAELTPSNYNWPSRIATARKSETALRFWPNQSAVGIPLI